MNGSAQSLLFITPAPRWNVARCMPSGGFVGTGTSGLSQCLPSLYRMHNEGLRYQKLLVLGNSTGVPLISIFRVGMSDLKSPLAGKELKP